MRVLRRSWARACFSPRPDRLAGPSAAQVQQVATTLSKAGYRMIPQKCVCVDGWVGLVLRSLECSHVAGQHLLLPPAPTRALHEVTPPCVGTPHSALHTPAQQYLLRKKPSAWLVGWAGPGWGCSLHHRSGQLPQEAPPCLCPFSWCSPWKGPEAGQGPWA